MKQNQSEFVPKSRVFGTVLDMAKCEAHIMVGAARDSRGMPRTEDARAGSSSRTNQEDRCMKQARTSGAALLVVTAILSSCLFRVSMAAPYSSQLAFRRTMGSEGSIRRKVNSHRFSLDNHASHRFVLLLHFVPPPHTRAPARPKANGPKFVPMSRDDERTSIYTRRGRKNWWAQTCPCMKYMCTPHRVSCFRTEGIWQVLLPPQTGTSFKRALAPLCSNSRSIV